MHKIILAAVALSALGCGVAMAGPPLYSSPADGPMAYPDWRAQWERLKNNQAPGWGWVPGPPPAAPTMSTTHQGTTAPKG